MRRNKKDTRLLNRTGSAGYTIVESMIFLAVSAILAVGALRLVSGQQAKTEFTQAVRDFDSRLQDIINDVATGYYVNTNNYTCNRVGGAPVVSAGSGRQGGNKDCIYLGQIIGFGEDNGRSIRLYTLVGLRQNTDPKPEDVKSLSEAVPRVVNLAGATLTENLLNGVSIRSVRYDDGAITSIGAFGFATNFNGAAGIVKADSTSADVYPIVGTSFGGGGAQIEANVTSGLGLSVVNPSRGIFICIESTARLQQYAIITIGSNGRQLGTQVQFIDGDVAADQKCD